MCVPMSSVNSVGGSGMGEQIPRPLKVIECYLKMHMDSHVLDSYVDIICIYSLLSIYNFNFSKSVKSKTSLYNICYKRDDKGNWWYTPHKNYDHNSCIGSIFQKIFIFIFIILTFYKGILLRKAIITTN